MVSLGAGAPRHRARAVAVPRRLDHDALFAARGEKLETEAGELGRRFDEAFWLGERGFKEPCGLRIVAAAESCRARA